MLHPGLDGSRMIHESVRRLINLMVSDLIDETERRLDAARPVSADALRALDHPVVAFSDQVHQELKALRQFLHQNMYRHYKVMRMARKADRVVKELFQALFAYPDCLPPEWRQAAAQNGEAGRALAISDYIAGMTDRFAADEHDRLFQLTKRDP